MTQKMYIYHIRGHTDIRKNEGEFVIPNRLNVRADDILVTKPRVSISTNILNTVITIYIKCRYHSNNYIQLIRSHCGNENVR